MDEAAALSRARGADEIAECLTAFGFSGEDIERLTTATGVGRREFLVRLRDVIVTLSYSLGRHGVVEWFSSPNRALRSRTPLAALAGGDLGGVELAVRSLDEGSYL